MESTTDKKKGILKLPKKWCAVGFEKSPATKSSTIDAVRWDVPGVERAHSSAPSRSLNAPGESPQKNVPRNSLKDLSSLQECVQFIHHWKEQVDQVCKERHTQREARCSEKRAQRSLQESRKLILEWADELHHVDKLLKETPNGRENEDGGEEAQTQIMEWAKELQMATESCGVQSDKLRKVMHLLSQRTRLLVRLAPLLEFITWSLLKENCSGKVPQLWLLAKQRTWKAGIPRYIPNSVWSWICSAAADVILDAMTNNPWLQLSDDQRRVQEGHSLSDPPYCSQRFDSWPCVLGWEGYNCGRHYWEVDIANNGCWRAGMTTPNSKRQGHFPMTPKQNYWVLWRSAHHFYACTQPETELPVGLAPRRLGVYLDYEEGQISFYNAETKYHIFTFAGSFKGKLYPLFAPMDGQTLMTVIEPHAISVK